MVKLAATLKQLDEADDADAITSLSKMSLPQMTAQIRNIEQRALNLAQDESNEEFFDAPAGMEGGRGRMRERHNDAGWGSYDY